MGRNSKLKAQRRTEKGKTTSQQLSIPLESREDIEKRKAQIRDAWIKLRAKGESSLIYSGAEHAVESIALAATELRDHDPHFKGVKVTMYGKGKYPGSIAVGFELPELK